MSVREISSLADFSAVLQGAGSTKIVVVDFTATWCGPCKMVAPHFVALASKYKTKGVFVKVDVDNAKDVAQKYQVRSMPTFMFFHKGVKVEEFSGAQVSKLTETLERLIKSCSPFSGAGFSLGSSGSGTSSAATAAKASSSDSGRRANPWADPNFVPPYLRQQQTQVEKTPEKNSKTASAKTPWADPSFQPKAPSMSTAPAASAALRTSHNAEEQTNQNVDAELSKAIAMSMAENNDASEHGNDPALLKDIDQTLLAEVLGMGFGQVRSEKALLLSKAKNLEDATNWLLEHEDDVDIDEPLSIVAPDPKTVRGAPLGVVPGADYEDDLDDDVVENLKRRAAREKKEIMKEIGDAPLKPLSEMTKEEKLEHLEKLKAARKIQKAKAEKQALREREIQRRQNTKDVAEARRKREELALKRAANAKKREKKEAAERRKRIKEKIAREKAERAERQSAAKPSI